MASEVVDAERRLRRLPKFLQSGTAVERFLYKAPRDPDTDCWEWQGYRGPYGVWTFDAKKDMAHRWSWTLFRGPIPNGLQIDHLCRNHGCVNPAHLEPVTCQENLLRGNGATARNAAKTHCINGHELSAENLRMSAGKRVCRTCQRDWMRRHRANAR